MGLLGSLVRQQMARFHIGLPPDEFRSTTGWSALQEPSTRELNRASIPIALALFGAAAAAWYVLDVSVLDALKIRGITDAVELILGFVALLLVHELVHAGLHPRFGLSRSSVLGVSFRPWLLYATYQDALSRNRFTAVLLGPFAALTLLPLILHSAGILSNSVVGAVAAASATNAAASSVDILGAYLVLRQVPVAGLIRNKGWYTYWRLDVS